MKPDPIKLTIDDLAFDGKAVAHRDGKVVFLDAGLPGEEVLVRITRSKRRFDQAKVIEILSRASSRIPAVCEHFEQCGGCSWQDMRYEDQLRFKKQQVIECVARIGGFENAVVNDCLPAAEPFHYRNKMEFSFHHLPDDDFRLGLHRRGRFDDIFDVNTCHLQSELASRLLVFVRDFVRREKIPVYDVSEHHGYLRFLVIRQTWFTKQLMVNLVTNLGPFAQVQQFVDELTAEFPEITTIVHGRNGKKSNIAVAEEEDILFGPGYIEEELLGCRFRIRANSFFQTNSAQAERLYQTGFDLFDPSPDNRVLDLYCGTGTIGLLLASRVQEVVGVELVEDAVAMARENAELNRVENISFFQGHVRDFLRENKEQAAQADAAVIDPPRAGLHPKALKRMLELDTPRLLYISCNPATFARDAKALAAAGYEMSAITPVDMFPHTRHIELVSLFSR